MKVELSISKAGTVVYRGERDIIDAKSFGEAFASAWSEMRTRRLGRTTSIGDFMDAMSESELDELDGAVFTLRKL